ncbi:MAG TPA: CBS domain-containing protein [Polyangiales bacterium]|nr:CBS domain-containing protein [Polyangiales bacterium]
MTSVSTLMTRDHLVTIGPEATVSDAARRLASEGISHLLVTGEGDRLLGVFCACDLEHAATGSRLRQHITARPITVDVTTDAHVALELMEDQQVSCLPVLDAACRLRGVITLHELRRRGLVDSEEERCSACGTTEHVRCSPHRALGLCIECSRKSEPPNVELDIETELGGGD